jgi:nucleotide-binding universal stress UspA family protein
MDESKKRVLVAVDGSQGSFEAVRYVSELLPPDRLEVTLFHVVTSIPENFRDIEGNPAFRPRLASVRAWEIGERAGMEEYLAKAKKLLADRGFPEDAVRAESRERQVGIARDIVFEAQKGYDAVAVGRRGMSNIQDLVLGSVVQKLLACLMNIPLWIVGEYQRGEGAVVALDASEGAMKAVEYAGRMFGGTEARIMLFHVIRGVESLLQGYGLFFSPGEHRDWIGKVQEEFERAKQYMNTVFDTARSRLQEAGIPAERIETKLLTGAASRAVSIVEEARARNFSTIVVGRRGLSRVEEFFIGRVSNKVVHLARDKAVWVVS